MPTVCNFAQRMNALHVFDMTVNLSLQISYFREGCFQPDVPINVILSSHCSYEPSKFLSNYSEYWFCAAHVKCSSI